jgi:hypothetical protein
LLARFLMFYFERTLSFQITRTLIMYMSSYSGM